MEQREWLPIREYFWDNFKETYGTDPRILCPKCGERPHYESFNHSDNNITINYSFKCSCDCGHEYNQTVVYRA